MKETAPTGTRMGREAVAQAALARDGIGHLVRVLESLREVELPQGAASAVRAASKWIKNVDREVR